MGCYHRWTDIVPHRVSLTISDLACRFYLRSDGSGGSGGDDRRMARGKAPCGGEVHSGRMGFPDSGSTTTLRWYWAKWTEASEERIEIIELNRRRSRVTIPGTLRFPCIYSHSFPPFPFPFPCPRHNLPPSFPPPLPSPPSSTSFFTMTTSGPNQPPLGSSSVSAPQLPQSNPPNTDQITWDGDKMYASFLFLSPPDPYLPPRPPRHFPFFISPRAFTLPRFNIYILDYCKKRGYHKTASQLVTEADIPPESKPPINAQQGLLFEFVFSLLVVPPPPDVA